MTSYAWSPRMTLEAVAKAAEALLESYQTGDKAEILVEVGRLKLAVKEAQWASEDTVEKQA